MVKDSPAHTDAGDEGLIPWSRRSPVGGNGNPPQYSCLENPMDRGAWLATVHGVAKNWTQLNEYANTHWDAMYDMLIITKMC